MVRHQQTPVKLYGRHRRGWWVLALIGLLVVGCGGVWFASHRDALADEVNAPAQTLASPSRDGLQWTVQARVKNGYLCLSLDERHVGKSQGSQPVYADVSCEFDNTKSTASGSFIMATDDGSLWMGPAPANAVKVRVAEHVTVPTHAIPGKAYRGVRYWYYVFPSKRTAATGGTVCGDMLDDARSGKGERKIQAYDRNGHAIPFGRDYVDPHRSTDPSDVRPL